MYIELYQLFLFLILSVIAITIRGNKISNDAFKHGNKSGFRRGIQYAESLEYLQDKKDLKARELFILNKMNELYGKD